MKGFGFAGIFCFFLTISPDRALGWWAFTIPAGIFVVRANMDLTIAAQQLPRHIPTHLRMPWEMGYMGRVFGCAPDRNTDDLLQWVGPIPPEVPAAEDPPEPAEPEQRVADGDEAEMTSLRGGEVMLAKLDRRKPSVRTWYTIRMWERRKAMDLWMTVMHVVGKASNVFVQMQEMKSEDERREMLVDVMQNRATSTLLGRAYQLLAFIRWLTPYGAGLAFPVQEPMAYRYVRWLRQVGAKPTRAMSFVQAISLLNFLLDVRGGGSIKSSRVMGAVDSQFMMKRVRRPRDPLTASMVSTLEELTISHPDVRTRVFIGFLTAMVHWRARLSDAQFVRTEPTLDFDLDGTAIYLEAEVDSERTKTGQSTKRARQTIHLVGLAQGLRGKPWAQQWLSDRKTTGCDAKVDGTLMPSPEHGGFSKRPLGNEDMTLWMREVLVQAGFALPSVANLGMHTPKHTLLGWASRFGMSKGNRRDLGYHLNPKDRSVAAYSRDMLSRSLRDLEHMVEEMAAGTFDPDATRSGRFKRSTGAPVQSDSVVGPQRASVVSVEDDADDEREDPAPRVAKSAAAINQDVPDQAPEANQDDDEWFCANQPVRSACASAEVEGSETPPLQDEEEDQQVPTELADSSTDDGPTSAEGTDDAVECGSDLPDSDGEDLRLQAPEPEDETWNKDGKVPSWYLLERNTSVSVKSVEDLPSKPFAGEMPEGGLWIHRVRLTLHKRSDSTTKCGRKGLFSTYVQTEVVPKGSHRCGHCFPKDK